jgi:5-methylcytosine-specific restriction endonuclease McrBC regulatory subunit McrC
MIVTVPERGTTSLSPGEWTALSSDHRFWRLIEANIIQAEASTVGRWRLRGTCYVGRAIIGQTLLQVSEKFPNAFETLVGLGILKSPKTLRVTSPISPSMGSTAVLVSLFVQAVRRYLSGSKKLAYIKVQDSGALIGGRLNIARTIRLRAKGASHQAAFDRTVLSADLPFNRCIYAALREVERLGPRAKVSYVDIAMARALRLGLSECLPGVLSMKPNELSEIAAKEALRNQDRFELADVISLAGAVLDTAGFGGAEAWKRSVEHAWFVNLESFFEEAVRQTISKVLQGTAAVSPPSQRPSLFRPSNRRYRATPDIVVSNIAGEIVAIGDAKYKDFSDWPTQSDVYELIAHAAAYGTNKALLFYPGDNEFSMRSFGTSATGCDVWAAGLSFDGFIEDVRRALAIAGITTIKS